MTDNAIEIEGLTKVYGGPWTKKMCALDSLNLIIPRGCVFGFLGPNGAGKTTTIRCLMDLIRPTDGQAIVLGEQAGHVKTKGKIGYLQDNPNFTPYLTGRQFLNICAKLLKMPKDTRNDRIDEVLEIVKMSKHENLELSAHSRGMLQRVGIAQAILNDPELLILDEPLVGLDPEGRLELLEIVRRQKEKGVCIFFCSHILSDVEKLCDQVGILNEGKLQLAGDIKHHLQVTGINVTIPDGEKELINSLHEKARSSHRDELSNWVLEFDKEYVKWITEMEMKETVKKEKRLESLEDLFFRVVKKGENHD
ncbi:MAG: ABC transporter ATP-binding protein [Lentisphaeria bacterium]|nr:ABC transporter ATP-binding protein [Lentisphaeria bacterium]NQZ69564.1 ABC transporter ATP-binding protein [Lentisphaeria bacterium]